MDNKVRFNLKNVHYAVNNGTIDSPDYATPVHVPGAVSLSLDPEGSVEPFYADGITYYQAVANNGYSGDLEMALFPDAMLADVWGFTIDDADKVLIENATVEPKSFALLYQIDGDQNHDYYCLYNCTGTRPGIGGETNTDTKSPLTKTSTISATPLADGTVMARTTSQTTSVIMDDWFTTVYQ